VTCCLLPPQKQALRDKTKTLQLDIARLKDQHQHDLKTLADKHKEALDHVNTSNQQKQASLPFPTPACNTRSAPGLTLVTLSAGDRNSNLGCRTQPPGANQQGPDRSSAQSTNTNNATEGRLHDNPSDTCHSNGTTQLHLTKAYDTNYQPLTRLWGLAIHRG
jgi:hypothetical protein